MLTKKTVIEEAIIYRTINGRLKDTDPKFTKEQVDQLKAMKPFTPTFFGADDLDEKAFISLH